MSIRKRISDRLYQVGPGRYYQPTYRRIAEAIGLESGAFLDVGCGPGWLSLHVAAGKLDIDAVGIDHSEQMVAAARKNKGNRLNITIREMKAEAIKFPEATFDAAAAVQTAVALTCRFLDVKIARTNQESFALLHSHFLRT